MLEEKELRYTDKMVEFESHTLETPQFRKHFPRGMIPVIFDGNVQMSESIAILMYLEMRYQLKPLLPTVSARNGAKVLVLLHEAEYIRSVSILGVRDGSDVVKCDLVKELLQWENQLKESGGPYMVGDTLTLADIAFFPPLAYLVRIGLDLDLSGSNISNHPAKRLSDYYLKMVQRPSVRKTWPPHWRTSDGDRLLGDVFLKYS